MKFKEAIDFALNEFALKLPENFHYHSLPHTKMVMDQVLLIAKFEKLSEGDTSIVMTAAAFHDIGFIFSLENHEQVSADFARLVLPNFGFEPSLIAEIERLIQATKIPQRPHNKLAEILCDADLAYLGGEKYLEIAELLYQEMKHFNLIESREAWQKLQINFLEKHQFWTTFAKKSFNSKKQEYLNQLR